MRREFFIFFLAAVLVWVPVAQAQTQTYGNGRPRLIRRSDSKPVVHEPAKQTDGSPAVQAEQKTEKPVDPPCPKSKEDKTGRNRYCRIGEITHVPGARVLRGKDIPADVVWHSAGELAGNEFENSVAKDKAFRIRLHAAAEYAEFKLDGKDVIVMRYCANDGFNVLIPVEPPAPPPVTTPPAPPTERIVYRDREVVRTETVTKTICKGGWGDVAGPTPNGKGGKFRVREVLGHLQSEVQTAIYQAGVPVVGSKWGPDMKVEFLHVQTDYCEPGVRYRVEVRWGGGMNWKQFFVTLAIVGAAAALTYLVVKASGNPVVVNNNVTATATASATSYARGGRPVVVRPNYPSRDVVVKPSPGSSGSGTGPGIRP